MRSLFRIQTLTVGIMHHSQVTNKGEIYILPCEQEQVQLASQGVGQTQANQSWIHSVSIDYGKKRRENDQ